MVCTDDAKVLERQEALELDLQLVLLVMQTFGDLDKDVDRTRIKKLAEHVIRYAHKNLVEIRKS